MSLPPLGAESPRHRPTVTPAGPSFASSQDKPSRRASLTLSSSSRTTGAAPVPCVQRQVQAVRADGSGAGASARAQPTASGLKLPAGLSSGSQLSTAFDAAAKLPGSHQRHLMNELVRQLVSRATAASTPAAPRQPLGAGVDAQVYAPFFATLLMHSAVEGLDIVQCLAWMSEVLDASHFSGSGLDDILYAALPCLLDTHGRISRALGNALGQAVVRHGGDAAWARAFEALAQQTWHPSPGRSDALCALVQAFGPSTREPKRLQCLMSALATRPLRGTTEGVRAVATAARAVGIEGKDARADDALRAVLIKAAGDGLDARTRKHLETALGATADPPRGKDDKGDGPGDAKQAASRTGGSTDALPGPSSRPDAPLKAVDAGAAQQKRERVLVEAADALTRRAPEMPPRTAGRLMGGLVRQCPPAQLCTVLDRIAVAIGPQDEDIEEHVTALVEHAVARAWTDALEVEGEAKPLLRALFGWLDSHSAAPAERFLALVAGFFKGLGPAAASCGSLFIVQAARRTDYPEPLLTELGALLGRHLADSGPATAREDLVRRIGIAASVPKPRRQALLAGAARQQAR